MYFDVERINILFVGSRNRSKTHRVPTGMNASASVLTYKYIGMHVNLFS